MRTQRIQHIKMRFFLNFKRLIIDIIKIFIMESELIILIFLQEYSSIFQGCFSVSTHLCEEIEQVTLSNLKRGFQVRCLTSLKFS